MGLPRALGAVLFHWELPQVLEEPAGAVPKNIGFCLHAGQCMATFRVPQQPAGQEMLSQRCRVPCPLNPSSTLHSPGWHSAGPQHSVQLQRLRGADTPVPGTHT